jgi:GDP-L-galactose phosphorylase
MVDPAVFEIAGHIVLKRSVDFEMADQDWAWRLLEFASVSEECLDNIISFCLK